MRAVYSYEHKKESKRHIVLPFRSKNKLFRITHGQWPMECILLVAISLHGMLIWWYWWIFSVYDEYIPEERCVVVVFPPKPDSFLTSQSHLSTWDVDSRNTNCSLGILEWLWMCSIFSFTFFKNQNISKLFGTDVLLFWLALSHTQAYWT